MLQFRATSMYGTNDQERVEFPNHTPNLGSSRMDAAGVVRSAHCAAHLYLSEAQKEFGGREGGRERGRDFGGQYGMAGRTEGRRDGGPAPPYIIPTRRTATVTGAVPAHSVVAARSVVCRSAPSINR